MLEIKRIRIEIQTVKGLYGVDNEFDSKLNFLASDGNTCGKSSVLVALYYGLGFEEIVGGKGEKVLTSAYKNAIEVNEERLDVLESKIYLEITNGEETITIQRSAKQIGRDNRLVTIYYSGISEMNAADTIKEDMYVHMPNAATNMKGFHRFLEKFLHMQLPTVPASDDSQRKLYLQLVFSCMFIEQKHGWGDIFSGIPFLGIKDSKKRILEYILGLDTLNNEKKKYQLKIDEINIRNEWKACLEELYMATKKTDCKVVGLEKEPCILTEINISTFKIYVDDLEISNEIEKLEKEYQDMSNTIPKVSDNYDSLQKELELTEIDIENLESELSEIHYKINQTKNSISVIRNNLEVLEEDLRNNKDSARLRKLGSEIGSFVAKDICPTCNQKMDDSLLPNVSEIKVMSIDENIRHLEAQKKMLNYAYEGHKKNKKDLEDIQESKRSKIFTLRRLAKLLRTDLYAVDDNLSETYVYKKIEIVQKKEMLRELQVLLEEKKVIFSELSEKWKNYLESKNKIPKKKFSEEDELKVKKLQEYFARNLEKYGYKSVGTIKDIQISEDTYLPIVEGFDMKFDSSASDNIRAIWAYTIALMQVSSEMKGNHPNIVMFDEPKQQSIVQSDMDKFFESIIEIDFRYQAIIGITLKDSDAKKSIEKLQKDKYNLIMLSNKAFQKL